MYLISLILVFQGTILFKCDEEPTKLSKISMVACLGLEYPLVSIVLRERKACTSASPWIEAINRMDPQRTSSLWLIKKVLSSLLHEEKNQMQEDTRRVFLFKLMDYSC